MKLRVPLLRLADCLLWHGALLLLVFSYASAGIMGSGNESAGKYVSLVCLGVMLLLYLFQSGWKLGVSMTSFWVYPLLYTLYSFLTCLWAINRSNTYSISMSLAKNFIIIFIVYLCFQKNADIDSMLKLHVWCSLVLSVMALIRYGPDMIFRLLLSGKRIDNEFMNSNALGICSAFSLIIMLYFLAEKKSGKIWIIIAPVNLAAIAVSQSKKSFAVLFAGILLLSVVYIIADPDRHRRKNRLLIITAGIVLGIVIFCFSGIFRPVRERLMEYSDFILRGEITGISGASDRFRMELIETGRQIFIRHPVTGIGTDNAKFIVASYTGEELYLHNNFYEVLTGGGMTGLIFYYWFWIYLIYRMLKLRKFADEKYYICFFILIMRLILDYASVQYPVRVTYFSLMIPFFYVYKAQRESRGNRYV